jgi:7-carboxy-7-deazaguanine synthase
MSGSTARVLVVNEIFTSIQGESTRAGLPSTFVRLTACNLRCTYCDTAYAFHEGSPRAVPDVIDDVVRRGVKLVTVTGGEPLLQDPVYDLIRELLDRGFDVQIETSGSVPTNRVDPRARVILDVKSPGSGESAAMQWENLDRIQKGDEVKLVLVDRNDYEWARGLLRSGRIPKGATVLLSPAHGTLDPKTLAAWMLEDGLDARLQIQIHKYIWGDDARGV